MSGKECPVTTQSTLHRSALSYQLTMAVVVVVVLLLSLTSASVLPGLTSSPGSQASSPYQYTFSLSQSDGQQERNPQTGKLHRL